MTNTPLSIENNTALLREPYTNRRSMIMDKGYNGNGF